MQVMGHSRHNENDMAIKMHYKKPDLWKIATQIQQFKQRHSVTTAKTIIATFPLRMRTDHVLMLLDKAWLKMSDKKVA